MVNILSYIYKITNKVNNKLYIGKTDLINPEDRWKEHLHDYKRRRCEKRPLYSAMNKYGVENFSFEVIESNLTDDEACAREKYWIENLRTYVGFKDCNGYNATLGGDGKKYLNLDEEEVIRYHIEESVLQLKNTVNHFNVDRETIKKILNKYNIPKLTTRDSKYLDLYLKFGGIYQVDENNNIINIFLNGKDVIDNIPNVNEKSLYDALNKHSYKLYGYKWYYGKDLPLNMKTIY